MATRPTDGAPPPATARRGPSSRPRRVAARRARRSGSRWPGRGSRRHARGRPRLPLRSPDALEQRREARDRGQACPQRDVVTGQPFGGPSPVPPLVGVVDARLHVLGQAEAARRVATHLARRGVERPPLSSPPRGRRGRRTGLLPGGSAAQQPRHQRRGDVTSVGPVGTLRSHLDGELVPVQLRGLAREADTPGVEHQTRVQPSPHVLVGEVQRPGQRHRQRRRAQRLARWEPEAEVGQPRHPGDEIDQAHRYSLPPPRTPPSGDASVDGPRWSRRTTVTESTLRATCDVRGTTNHVAATRP
jgi:hypothetical protein